MEIIKFKKIIKDCLREVLKEEGFLNIQPIQNNPQKTNELKSTGNPLFDLLNETRMEGNWIENDNSLKEHNKSNTIGNVISNNKNIHDINLVNIDVVPDYSQLMKKINL